MKFLLERKTPSVMFQTSAGETASTKPNRTTTMNHTELQDALNKRVLDSEFYESGHTAKRRPCPCCCPNGNFRMTWAKGTSYAQSGNPSPAFQCGNCGHTEYFKARNPREGKTPSQEKAIAKVKSYFTKHALGLLTFEEKWSGGTLWFYVDDDHLYGTRASFTVGRGGKLDCWGARSLGQNETTHVAFIVGASINKNASL
jgi:hypothetical protein